MNINKEKEMKRKLLDPEYEIGGHATRQAHGDYASDYWQVWLSVLPEARGGPD